MNLVLIGPEELRSDGTVRLTDRRALHLREVLRVALGERLRIGILEGPLGVGEVVALGGDGVTLRCHIENCTPPPGRDTLLLAVPRPRVLLRIYEQAAALGFGRILLVRTWRVDRSHLDSRALRREQQDRHLRRGLEQGRRTRLPAVTLHPLFRPFVEDQLEELIAAQQRFLAHPPSAPGAAALAPLADAPLILAIGPEGGFIPFEIEMLRDHGFQPFSLGAHPLRVETALAAAYAQLELLRAQGS